MANTRESAPQEAGLVGLARPERCIDPVRVSFLRLSVEGRTLVDGRDRVVAFANGSGVAQARESPERRAVAIDFIKINHEYPSKVIVIGFPVGRGPGPPQKASDNGIAVRRAKMFIYRVH